MHDVDNSNMGKTAVISKGNVRGFYSHFCCCC